MRHPTRSHPDRPEPTGLDATMLSANALLFWGGVGILLLPVSVVARNALSCGVAVHSARGVKCYRDLAELPQSALERIVQATGLAGFLVAALALAVGSLVALAWIVYAGRTSTALFDKRGRGVVQSVGWAWLSFLSLLALGGASRNSPSAISLALPLAFIGVCMCLRRAMQNMDSSSPSFARGVAAFSVLVALVAVFPPWTDPPPEPPRGTIAFER